MTLIDRLSKLEGPDREYDSEILSVLMPEGFACGTFPPHFTASVDAALALADRVLPDHQTGYLPSFFKDSAYAGIVSEKGKAVDLLKSTIEGGSTPAIALCIAILRAKEASHGE